MRSRNYRGKRRGFTAEQAIIAAVFVIEAVLLMTMKASSQWTGMEPAEQLKQAICETKDWE